MKKLAALFMALLMFSAQIVSASEYENSKAYFEITALGIMQGDENGDLHIDDPLTRAEFATVITRLMGYDDSIGMGSFSPFSDVSENDWFAGYVGLMYGMGIMNGVSESEFSPYTYITYEQAMKTLVCMLGYGTAAERAGGYPEGYIAIGTKIRLNEDVRTFSDFTRGDIMQMCYNSLDVHPVTYENQEKSPTFREIHAGGKSGVYHSKGVVTANFETWLNAPNSSLEIDEVEIDDKVYKLGNTDANMYLGQMVEFYAIQDEYGIKDKLVAVKPYKTNQIAEILWEDVKSTSLSEIVYREDRRSRTINIDGAKIIKNGRLIWTPKEQDITAEKGSVKIISYDGDSAADIVFIDDYRNVRIKSVKGNVLEFAEGFLYKGSRYLAVNMEDEDVYYSIWNGEGKQISLADIKEGDILSISSDANNEVYRLVVSSDNVSGNIRVISKDSILIDDTECRVYDGDVFEVKPGIDVTAYLDYKGFIADIEEIDSENAYAYVVATGHTRALSSRLELRMVIGSKVAFTYEENENNPDSTDLIPILNCKNSAVEVLKTAEKFKLDGKRFDDDDDEIYPGLYSYKLNSEGEITELVTAFQDGGGTGMRYNPYDKTFYLDSRTPIGLNEETMVVCLPKRDTINGETVPEFEERLSDTSDEDYMVPLEISNKDSTISYDVFGYDLDTDTKKVNVLVFYEKMNEDNIVQINTDTSPIGIVSDIYWVRNEDDDFVQAVSILTSSGTTDYLAANIVSGKNDILDTLREGDLIYYEVGLSGKLDDAEIIYSFYDRVDTFSKNSGTDDYQVCGYVVDVLYDEIEPTSGNVSTVLKVDTPTETVPVTVYQRNKPQMFIVDRETDEIRIASVEELLPGQDELFFALIPLGGKAKACVIYR